MSADLAFQKALGSRLAGFASLTAFVPANSILDRHERPAPRPSIILGQSQVMDEDTSLKRKHHRVYHDLHIWVKEPSTEKAKAIAWEVRKAIHSERLALDAGFHCADARVSATRFLRDPDGETSHGIVSISALIVEV